MDSTETRSSQRTERDTWPPGEALMVQWRGKWMTYAQFEAERLNEIMPRQPKREWGYRALSTKQGPDKHAEYRRQLLDARHQ